MTIAWVQSDQSLAGSGTSATCVFGSNTVSGNAIIACVFWKTDVTISSVTDVESNSYEDCGEGRIARPTDGYMQILGAPNITGGTTPTITVNFSGSATEVDIYVLEYSGASISDLFDATSGSGTATSGTTASTGSYDAVNAEGAIIAFAVGNAGSGSDVAFSGEESYTNREVNASFPYAQGVADAVYTSDIGAETTVVTFGATITKAVLVIAILNAAAAPAASGIRGNFSLR